VLFIAGAVHRWCCSSLVLFIAGAVHRWCCLSLVLFISGAVYLCGVNAETGILWH
jgi:hypothetical protein